MHNEVLNIIKQNSYWKKTGGAAHFDTMINVGFNASFLPSAFVVPISISTIEVGDRPNDFYQRVKQTVSVLIAVPAIDDETGEKANAEFDKAFGELKKELLGVQLSTASSSVSFDGMDYIDSANGASWFNTTWSADYVWRLKT